MPSGIASVSGSASCPVGSPMQTDAQTHSQRSPATASPSANKARPMDGLRIGSKLLLMLAQVAVPGVTQSPGFIGIPGLTDIGTRSGQSPSLLTRPDFSFAIWGLIFAAMAGFAVYQALPANWANARLRRLGGWTAAAMGLNATWEFVAAWLGITFVTVVLIFLILAVRLKAFSTLHDAEKMKPIETALVVFPISIFAAWVTVACVLNTVSWLFNAGGMGFGGVAEGTWVALFAVLAGVIGATVIWIHRGNVFLHSGAGLGIWRNHLQSRWFAPINSDSRCGGRSGDCSDDFRAHPVESARSPSSRR